MQDIHCTLGSIFDREFTTRSLERKNDGSPELENLLDFAIYTTIGIIRCTLGLATDDLAEKPYIPQNNYFYEFVANVLHDNIGILIFDLHGGC